MIFDDDHKNHHYVVVVIVEDNKRIGFKKYKKNNADLFMLSIVLIFWRQNKIKKKSLDLLSNLTTEIKIKYVSLLLLLLLKGNLIIN